MSKEKEIAEGKAIIDLAKAAGAKTVVWSGLENVSEVTKGKITTVEHFDGKVRFRDIVRSYDLD